MIVVVTGFFFSFLFHWGTVEPTSSATEVKEAEQGKVYFRRLFLLLNPILLGGGGGAHCARADFNKL